MIIFSTSSILSDTLRRGCDDNTTHDNTTRSTVSSRAKYFHNKLVTRTYYSRSKTRLVIFSFAQYFQRKPRRSEGDRDQNRNPIRVKEREMANRDRAISIILASGDVKCAETKRHMNKRLSRQQRTSGKKAEERDVATSIIVAFTKNTSLPHQEVCVALLPYVAGWERIFVSELVTITNIGAIRKAKLLAIIEDVLENPLRLCRYCGSRAQNIGEYSYHCPHCGSCLSLGWIGGAK